MNRDLFDLETERAREPGSDGLAGERPEAPACPQPIDVPVWSVSAVNAAARTLLEGTFPPLWVTGEVANWRRARSGHCYFTLKDRTSQLGCVMWRSDAERLPTDPDEGMTLRVFGTLTIYERKGEYQLVVRRLEGEGAEGLWRLAFEKLRAKLAAEGLLAPERRRPLPRFPSTVGVVTSPAGAAMRDIITVIGRRAPWTRVVLCAARVQGEGAAAEIARAIRALATSGLVEVIIVGRGGGSVEDLWAFNEEPVARAIAECPVPVVSAVGHEVDVTIADLVADVRAPTPSAAAETVVPDRRAVADGLERLRAHLVTALAAAVERRRVRARDMADALERGMARVLERWRHRLAGVVAKVEALSPLATLRRGYAVPLGVGGQVLRRAVEFDAGMPFELRVVDGRVRSRVEESLPEESDGGRTES
ncbi:MAG: exodeoxyribonuclease VII large subunit [Gemmatimonadetes bacterium]|nr:exodeoxyribonuclease VII large subunit [Gemmatimonadota bacterium]